MHALDGGELPAPLLRPVDEHASATRPTQTRNNLGREHADGVIDILRCCTRCCNSRSRSCRPCQWIRNSAWNRTRTCIRTLDSIRPMRRTTPSPPSSSVRCCHNPCNSHRGSNSRDCYHILSPPVSRRKHRSCTCRCNNRRSWCRRCRRPRSRRPWHRHPRGRTHSSNCSGTRFR